MIILSICIPTFNRARFLKMTLDSIVTDPVFLESDQVEIVISDNCSTDETPEICKEYTSRFPDKIQYKRLDVPISGDENFIKVLNHGRGRYLRLNNDKLTYKPGSLSRIVEVLKKCEIGTTVFFTDEDGYYYNKFAEEFTLCHGFDEMMGQVAYLVTRIGGLCVESEEYHKIKNPAQYSDTHFGQIFILASILGKQGTCLVWSKQLSQVHPEAHSYRSYSIPKVFGQDFNTLLGIYIKEGILKPETLKRTQYFYLPIIIRAFYNDARWNIKTIYEYFYYLMPYYWKSKNFYWLSAKMLFKGMFSIGKRKEN